MTSCFVYKVMGLTYHDRINTQLIHRFEIFRFESHWLLFFCSVFIFIFRGGGGGGGGCLILLFYLCLFFFFLFLFIIFSFFIPLTCIRHIHVYKISVHVTTQTTVNSEIYANSVKRHHCDVKIRD